MNQARHRTRGFTLIELMVVIAILGIIALIAIPSYQEQVRKSHRSDAKASLMGIVQDLERCFTETNNFTTSPPCPSFAAAIPSHENFYNLTISNHTATTYTLTATATGTQTNDLTCFRMRINHLGAKTSVDDNGVDTTANGNCW